MAKKNASTSAGKKTTSKPAAAGSPPLIDTNRAANAAAAMIVNKSTAAPAAAGPKKESAAFKQLKAGVNKPAGASLGGDFARVQQPKKSNLPFGGGKQVGHNQTFGSEATRSGVPRRTSG